MYDLKSPLSVLNSILLGVWCFFFYLSKSQFLFLGYLLKIHRWSSSSHFEFSATSISFWLRVHLVWGRGELWGCVCCTNSFSSGPHLLQIKFVLSIFTFLGTESLPELQVKSSDYFILFFFTVQCEIFGIPTILSAKICSYRGVYALVPLVGRWEKKAEGAGRVSVLCLSKEQEEICTHCGPGMKIRHQGEFTKSKECRLAKSVCLRAFKHSWMPTSCMLGLGIQRWARFRAPALMEHTVQVGRKK